MIANELMIDDWVYNKNIDKPMQVYPMMLPQMFRRTPDATTEDYNIFPVPLTPEILEKNGFERAEEYGGYKWLFQEGDIWIIINDNFPASGKGHVIHIEYFRDWDDMVPTIYHDWISYVHELQHALRLCGIDKEIVL